MWLVYLLVYVAFYSVVITVGVVLPAGLLAWGCSGEDPVAIMDEIEAGRVVIIIAGFAWLFGFWHWLMDLLDKSSK